MFGMKPLAEDKVRSSASDQVAAARPDILDRNGEVLATDVKVMSIFAEPRRLIDKDEAVELLTAALPDVNAAELRKKLGSRKGFVWVKRAVTQKEQQEVFHLGLPGVGFLPENKRVYPNGPIAAHVLGYANLDGVGISGLEKYIDTQGLSDLTSMGFKVAADDLKPVTTSLDLRATYAVRDELEKGIAKFKAKNGAAAILDVNTGEVVAMASLPDFDPNQPADALDPNRINRLSVGVYEMGSTFKALTIAMGLQSNKITLRSVIDARNSLQYGRFTIHDFHAEHKMMTVPEVFYHSSNIGAAKIAMMVGIQGHQDFLRSMGQLTRLRTELPESAEPLIPKHWGMLNTITIAFGQGINVAPLQSLMAVGALANGGLLVTPTFLKRSVVGCVPFSCVPFGRGRVAVGLVGCGRVALGLVSRVALGLVSRRPVALGIVVLGNVSLARPALRRVARRGGNVLLAQDGSRDRGLGDVALGSALRRGVVQARAARAARAARPAGSVGVGVNAAGVDAALSNVVLGRRGRRWGLHRLGWFVAHGGSPVGPAAVAEYKDRQMSTCT